MKKKNEKKEEKKKMGFFKKFGIFFQLIFYAFGLAVPIYAIITEKGFLPIHIALICISTVSFLFYIVSKRAEDKSKKKELKAKRKKVKKARKYVKKLSKLYKILTTAYIVYFTASAPTPLSILLLIFMVLAFVIDLLITYAVWSVKKKIKSLKKSDDDEDEDEEEYEVKA